MRARHRHFNSRFAGAGIVLDSRYINQSNNTAVATWHDRSNNNWNAIQATSTAQPIFKTNQLNGNPVVSFDGTTDRLSINSATGYLNNVGYAILISLVKDRSPTTGNSNHVVGIFTISSSATSGRSSIFSRQAGVANWRLFTRRLDTDAATFPEFANDASYNIVTSVANYSGGNVSLQINNKQEDLKNLLSAGNTSATNSNNVTLGGFSTSTTDGFCFADMATFLAFNINIGAPLLTRIHHSMAYAFKLSCN